MTAVEWLLNEMFTNGGLKKEQGVMYISPELVAKAKEMEKNSYICNKCKSKEHENKL